MSNPVRCPVLSCCVLFRQTRTRDTCPVLSGVSKDTGRRTPQDIFRGAALNAIDALAEAWASPSVTACGQAGPSDLFDPAAFAAVIPLTLAQPPCPRAGT
jgi:hypothetical protein